MTRFKFQKDLYPKIALLKAAYTYTDSAYIHLDADSEYYYVELEIKQGAEPIDEKQFLNEMLTQSVRHMVYQQTKNIRELMLARAMATTIVGDTEVFDIEESSQEDFMEEDLLKDWFDGNE